MEGKMEKVEHEYLADFDWKGLISNTLHTQKDFKIISTSKAKAKMQIKEWFHVTNKILIMKVE